MITMHKGNIDYKGNEIWVDKQRFIAKTRVPQRFVKSNIDKFKLASKLQHK